MSTLTEILDRLSGISALRERVGELSGHIDQMRTMIVAQQRDVSNIQGQLRALIQIQSQNSRR